MGRHPEIAEWLEERQGRFIAIGRRSGPTPELALAEHVPARLQAETSRLDGFTITRNVGDLPTAFMAEWTQGEGGPVIGFLGEYDALPASQETRPDTQEPLVARRARARLRPQPARHRRAGRGQRAQGVAGSTPAQPATVRYYGCPAEETCEGKVFMARAGAFDDLDAALTWHPGSTTTPSGPAAASR